MSPFADARLEDRQAALMGHQRTRCTVQMKADPGLFKQMQTDSGFMKTYKTQREGVESQARHEIRYWSDVLTADQQRRELIEEKAQDDGRRTELLRRYHARDTNALEEKKAAQIAWQKRVKQYGEDQIQQKRENAEMRRSNAEENTAKFNRRRDEEIAQKRERAEMKGRQLANARNANIAIAEDMRNEYEDNLRQKEASFQRNCKMQQAEQERKIEERQRRREQQEANLDRMREQNEENNKEMRANWEGKKNRLTDMEKYRRRRMNDVLQTKEHLASRVKEIKQHVALACKHGDHEVAKQKLRDLSRDMLGADLELGSPASPSSARSWSAMPTMDDCYPERGNGFTSSFSPAPRAVSEERLPASLAIGHAPPLPAPSSARNPLKASVSWASTSAGSFPASPMRPQSNGAATSLLRSSSTPQAQLKASGGTNWHMLGESNGGT